MLLNVVNDLLIKLRGGIIGPNETGPVCLHLHMFKNAGTTLDYALQRNFGKRFMKFDNFEDHDNTFSKDDLEQFLTENSNALVVSSHQMRFPLPDERDIIAFAFLRNPIDRAFSVFKFTKKQNASSKNCEMASKMSMKEFLAECVKKEGITVVTNFQQNFLTGYMFDKDGHEVDSEIYLKIAKERMKQCQILGVVERMDESMVYAEHFLRQFYPKINMAFVRKNVTKDRQESLEKRLEAGRKEIGGELFEKLNEFNRLDMELHRYANQLLDERLEEVPDVEEQVRSFQKRCARLKR